MPAPSSQAAAQPSTSKPFFLCGLLLSILAAVMLAVFRSQARPASALQPVAVAALTTSSSSAVPPAATQASAVPGTAQPKAPAKYSVRLSVLNVVSHDPASFTQGLTFNEGMLIESTGLYGRSKLRKFAWPTGKLLKEAQLESRHFGEGSTVVGDKIILLTWKAKQGFIFNKQTLAKERSFTYQTTTGQGWGITATPLGLVVSDGSSFLHIWDPQTLRQVSRVQIKDEKGRPLERLNELEYVNGELLANVWFDTRIARIDVTTGELLGWIDCADILHGRPFRAGDDVLNGIASLSVASNSASMPLDGAELLLTGKRWDKMYHVRLAGKPKRTV